MPAPQTARPAGHDRQAGPSSVGSRMTDEAELRPYILAGELGKGSFAIVYKGYHEQTHEQVAIKTVSRNILTPKLEDNLKAEIDILKSLSHRHITKLMDIVRAERNIYLIMEYCSGGDLTQYIKKRGRVESLEYVPAEGAAPIYYPHPRSGGLDEIVVRSFLRQLARALKFLRHKNLIHRDIKPQNLLLKPAAPEELARGHPLGVPILKVADFGFARILPNATMAETLCGSPLYMAPEILRYEKYDAKADLWSVGAVLYETAVGKPPFRAQNHIDLLKKIEHSKGIKFPDEDPQFLERDPEAKPVPSDIKKLIRILLKKQPVERASFDDFFGSTALARSKFPRPVTNLVNGTNGTANGSGVNGSQGANGSNGKGRMEDGGEQEAVIVGTMRRNPRELTLADFPTTLDRQKSTSQAQQRSPVQQAPTPGQDVLAEDGIAPKVNFRRTASTNTSPPDRQRAYKVQEIRTSPPSRANDRLATGKPLSTEASIIPGETEEDGQLRREYVLVGDTRAIEFNKTVDEINAGRRRPIRPRSSLPSPTVEKNPNDIYNNTEQLEAIPQNANNTAFPPPPNLYAPPLSSSPSRSAGPLARAINLAAQKLFPGYVRSPSGYGKDRSASNSPRRQPLILGRAMAERDPLEEELLVQLEDLAQKTDVLTKWADEMYEYVKAVPQKPLPKPGNFVKREGESDIRADKRKTAETEAQFNAITCISLYLQLMTFSQRGISQLALHQEGMKMRDPEGNLEVSEGFDDALQWFKDHFTRCNDRVALVRTWLPEEIDVTPGFLDQLVYDRALQLSKEAARKEFIGHGLALDDCVQLYEESLWVLHALHDDIIQPSSPFAEEDKITVTNWIAKTKERLRRCRAKKDKLDVINVPVPPKQNYDPRYTLPWDGQRSPNSR